MDSKSSLLYSPFEEEYVDEYVLAKPHRFLKHCEYTEIQNYI